jgi:2,3-bisphosphoglycerate-independent phosphoglycerate mutase
MKAVVVVACGLADEPAADLGGKTPLEAARTPHLDGMASRGILGLTRTTPRGAPAGCETGTIALLGYDPAQHRVTAAGLEAAGLGVALVASDVPLRASLVTLETAEDGTEIMRDPMGGRLPPAEAAALAHDLAAALGGGVRLVPGLGHRHLLVWAGGDRRVATTSPYELVDRPVGDAMPRGGDAAVLAGVVGRSRRVLAEHPVCAARRARAERVPTVLWPWQPGEAAALPALHDGFGVDGAMIAATPLARGIGVAAGLRVVAVAGATGDGESDLGAKVTAAVEALATHDLVVVHVAAADVAGHAGDPQRKLQAIERLDELAIGPLLERLRATGDDWRVLVAADHPTPCAGRTHAGDPVPFVVASARDEARGHAQKRGASEKDAREQGIFVQEGHALLERLLRH